MFSDADYSNNKFGFSSLNDLALFRDIKEGIVHNEDGNGLDSNSKDSLRKNRPTFNDRLNQNSNVDGKKKGWSKFGVSKKRRKLQYYLPLSAFNTFDEAPFTPSSKGKYGMSTNSKFDEMIMKEELMKRRLRDIRFTGWNHIRSIGISKTMNQIDEDYRVARETEREVELQDRDHSTVDTNFNDGSHRNQQERTNMHERVSGNDQLPPAFQENMDEEGTSFHDLNNVDANMQEVLPQIDDEGVQDEEDELSYDYSADYARVEEDNDEDNSNQHIESLDNSEYGSDTQRTDLSVGNHRMLLHRDTNDNNLELDDVDSAANDPMVQFTNDFFPQTGQIPARSLTIQQYVESSHLRNSTNSYDTDNDFDFHRIDADADTANSRDYSEVPSLNISDTAQVNDNQRVSSLTETGRGMTIEQFERLHNSTLNNDRQT